MSKVSLEFTMIAEPEREFAAWRLERVAVDFAGAPLAAYADRQAAPYTLELRRLAPEGWRGLARVVADVADPHVQALPDGGILVVGTRSVRAPDGTTDSNAVVYAADGRERARFLAGDGVEDVQVTAEGELWVSYSDEGTMGDFGRYGWGRLSPRTWIEPVGGCGLARF